MDVVQQLQAILEQLDAIASNEEGLSFEVLNDLDEARFYRRVINTIQQEQQR